MEKKLILFLDEVQAKDLSLVGGKGLNLGIMIKSKFPIPAGFCITTLSYKEFIKQNKLEGFLEGILEKVCQENVRDVAEEIKSRIMESKTPEIVEKEIIFAFNRMGPYGYYAVRSSATAEDMKFASFAGQQDTYLNIKGIKSVLDSVKRCWASLFTDRAILYRIQNNIKHVEVNMAVVVQSMVLPTVSGIMFTADPLSGHRDIITIDASYGLGEALVSGLVTPDIYKFNKVEYKIESKVIAEKKIAVMPVEGGGTKRVELKEEKSNSQVLTDSQIISLSQLGKKIEKHYGAPQDIEWCLAEEQLFIVQSRSITSLFPLPQPIPSDDALHVYASFSHIQVMTDPISPLGIDMARAILSIDQSEISLEEYKYTKSAAGRIYIDLSGLLQNKTLIKRLPAILKNADSLLATALEELTSRTDFNRQIKKDKKTIKALRRFIVPIAIHGMKNLLYKNPDATVQFADDYANMRILEAQTTVNQARRGTERLEAIYKIVSFTKDFEAFLPLIMPAIMSFKILERLEEKLLGFNKYVNEILQGLEGNITTEMGLLTGDLADIIRKSPDLIKVFENEEFITLFDRLKSLDGHDQFIQTFNEFIEKYGSRAAGEIDIAKERWGENPQLLVKSIMAVVKTREEGSHRRDYSIAIRKGKKAAEELIREVEAKHGKIKGQIVRRLVRVLRNVMPLREHPKYLAMNLLYICKKAILEEANILVSKGQLIHHQDVFYLKLSELYDAVKRDVCLKEVVASRKEEYSHFQRLNPPRLMTSKGEEVKGFYKRENIPEKALVGIPVSSGVVEGIAKVIEDPTKASINKGEILIAPFTDPGWTPLFINTAALVMEVGGLLTHGTVVAREYGIPAVVGIVDATKNIKTGQKIRVDGDAGYVLVIEE